MKADLVEGYACPALFRNVIVVDQTSPISQRISMRMAPTLLAF
jgi:hypothetical protein